MTVVAPLMPLSTVCACGRDTDGMERCVCGRPATRVPGVPAPVMPFVYDDGGRADAGFTGAAPGDCVVRAIAIATGLPYRAVYDDLNAAATADNPRRRSTRARSGSRTGVHRRIYHPYLIDRCGWSWLPTMAIGSGCMTHLRADELPAGRLIVRVSRHVCAVVDGVVHDTADPSRDGTRCVYGFYYMTADQIRAAP
jgi:hypothetical protein